MNIKKIFDHYDAAEQFSGVFSARNAQGVLYEKCAGCRNRGEALPNNTDTAFAIASGTKLFTALAILKLIDAKKLSLDDKLWDILPYDLGQIDRRITLFHLLTHTSGIGDYLDEETPDSYEKERELCNQYPVYLWERLDYYLQMNTHLPPKFVPGARFGYSNAGFIMLGLAIEAAGGLPANTALGYMQNEAGAWRSNVFSLPIIGGSDGGLYTCAGDLDILWRAVFSGRVLSEAMLKAFLSPQVITGEETSYGLGVYRIDRGGNTAYYAVGGDFGVDFFTAFFPKQQIVASALGNTEASAQSLLEALFDGLL